MSTSSQTHLFWELPAATFRNIAADNWGRPKGLLLDLTGGRTARAAASQASKAANLLEAISDHHDGWAAEGGLTSTSLVGSSAGLRAEGKYMKKGKGRPARVQRGGEHLV